MSSDEQDVVIRLYDSSTDEESLYRHLQDLFRFESPGYSAFDFSEAECEPIYRFIMKNVEEADVSYVAVDNALSKGRSTIVGCILAGIEYRDDPNWKKPPYPKLTEKKQQILTDFYNELLKGQPAELLKQRVLRLEIFSVDPAYRRLQLGKKMLDLCLHDAATRKSCTAALVYVTSYKSQGLVRASNFVPVKEIYYDDYNKTLDKESYIVMKDPKNIKAELVWKTL